MPAPNAPEIVNHNWSVTSYPSQTQTWGYQPAFFATTTTNINSMTYTNNRYSCGCLCHIGYPVACNCSQQPCSPAGVSYQDMNQLATPLPASPANSLKDDLIELQDMEDYNEVSDTESNDLDNINPTFTFSGPI